MQRKNNLVYLLVIIITLFLSQTSSAQKGIPVKVAVIPFEVFSAADETGLGKDFAVMLSEKLVLNPYIFTSDMDDVIKVVKKEDGTLNAERLREIAKLLDANYVLFGSVTRINENTSIDVQLFNNFSPEGYAKSFAEGTDAETLIEVLSGKVELEILDKAEYIPPSQRMKTKTKSSAEMDEDFIFAMESGIGEDKKDLPVERKPAGDQVEIKSGEKKLSLEDELEEEFGSKNSSDIGTNKAAEQEIDETDLKESDAPVKENVSEEVIAKPKKRSKKSSFKFDKPVNINADSLEYDNSANRIIFNGNVVARQGDIVFFADKMDVLYTEGGDLKKITATGNVKVTQGERIATGKKIIFHSQDQKIVVTGNPRVWQGDNVIQGKKITVFLKEDRSVVEGGPESRVNATIYPGKSGR